MSIEKELTISDEKEQKKTDIKKLREELEKEIKSELSEQDKREVEVEERENLEEEEQVNKTEEERIKLTKVELFILKFMGENYISTGYGSNPKVKEHALRFITYSLFDKENFDKCFKEVETLFDGLINKNLINVNRSGNHNTDYGLTEEGKQAYSNYDFDSQYDLIKEDVTKRIVHEEIQWVKALCIIKEKGIYLEKLSSVINELQTYGMVYCDETDVDIKLMSFLEKNTGLTEALERTKYNIKTDLNKELKAILKKEDKKHIHKLFACDVLECKNTFTKYPGGFKKLLNIVKDNSELFERLYVFESDGKIIDIFDIKSMVKGLVKEEDVIETLYGDIDELIKSQDLTYNEFYDLFNSFREEMITKFKDLIIVSIDENVYIPEFLKKTVSGLFYKDNEDYLKLMGYISQNSIIDESNKKFCDMLIDDIQICKKTEDSYNYLKNHYTVYYSDIMNKIGYDELRIQYEPAVRDYLMQKMTTKDVKTYYLLELIDKLNNKKEDKQTILERFLDGNSLQKLESVHFLNMDDREKYLTSLGSYDTIRNLIKNILTYEKFKEEINRELKGNISELTEKEKIILCLMVIPESLDTKISINLGDTSRLFSEQIIKAKITGQDFEKIKKKFYIINTSMGYTSILKDYFNGMLDDVNIENAPYVLLDMSKEDTNKKIEDLFKNKKPSYFYRLLSGELDTEEVTELMDTGLVLSDGCNNPIVHPDLKRVFKDEWNKRWKNLDKLIGNNIIRETENEEEKVFCMDCNIETFRIHANPYMNIESVGDDWIDIKIINKNFEKDTLRLRDIDFEHDLLISEELVLNKFNPKESQDIYLKGFTAIEISRGVIYSANLHWNEIAKGIEVQFEKDIRTPNKYFSCLHDLKEKVDEKKSKEKHEKTKKEIEEKEEEEEEFEEIDEIWEEIFFEEEEEILFEHDKYLNGKLKTFTFLVHGLPGCGKTKLTEIQTKQLKNKIKDKLDWKSPLYNKLSIKDILDHRASPVDYCHSYFSIILRELKPSKNEMGRPGIIIIQDLDAIAEQKLAPTSDVKEGQKIGLLIKDFLKQIFEKQEYQVAVFAEATNLNNIPEYLLQFFPNRKVLLAPSIEKRETFFNRIRVETIKEKFASKSPKILKEIIDIIGLPIKEEHAKILAQHTQGFTYRDLSVLTRDLKQHITEKPDENQIIKAIKRYDPSLPQYLRIEVPKVHWDDVIGLEDQKQKVEEALLLTDDKHANSTMGSISINPAKGVLFYGVPGTGKTYLAKAIANRSNAFFIHLTAPQIFSKYFGESERNLKHIFTIAKELSASSESKVIIFIDELDGFAPSREQIESRPERSVLSVLLSELDGLEELTNITIIGTTNRPYDVDPALIRPGRFDERIEFKPQEFDTCVKIFDAELKKIFGNDHSGLPPVKEIANSLESLKERTYDSTQNYNEEEIKNLFVSADLSSFAHRISRLYNMNREGDTMLKLVKDKIDLMIEDKENRIIWESRKIGSINK